MQQDGAAYDLGDPSRTAVTVRDDDRQTVTIADTRPVPEGSTLAFPVTLTRSFDTQVTVRYTLAGTAVAGEDHDGAASGAVTFAPGETEKVTRLVTDEGAAGNERVLEVVEKGGILPAHRLRDRKGAAVVEAVRDRTASGRTTSPSVFAAGRFHAAAPDRR